VVAQAHDQLHKGNIVSAHEMMHKALGVDNSLEIPSAPISHRFGFDQAFRTACRKNGVTAMYVLVDTVDHIGNARLLSGGNAELCTLIDRKLR
jgi:hypothetical protein